MRFYGNGVVWDAENNKRLCKFSRVARGKKGVLDTDDKRTQAILIERGYEHEPFATGGLVEPAGLYIEGETGTELAAPVNTETETAALDSAEVKIVAPAPMDFEGAADSSEADLPKPPANKTPFVTADMKPAELREIGRGLGLKFPVGVTKVDMAKAINEAKK